MENETLCNALQDLLSYARACSLLAEEDVTYTRNALLAAFGLTDFTPSRSAVTRPLEDILQTFRNQTRISLVG